MTFANPEFLWALLVLPVLALLRGAGRQKRLADFFERGGSKGRSKAQPRVGRTLEISADVACARPAYRRPRPPANRHGIQRARGKRNRHRAHNRRFRLDGGSRFLRIAQPTDDAPRRRQGSRRRVRRKTPERQNRHGGVRGELVFGLAHDAQPRLAETEPRTNRNRRNRRQQNRDRLGNRHERKQTARPQKREVARGDSADRRRKQRGQNIAHCRRRSRRNLRRQKSTQSPPAEAE